MDSVIQDRGAVHRTMFQSRYVNERRKQEEINVEGLYWTTIIFKNTINCAKESNNDF